MHSNSQDQGSSSECKKASPSKGLIRRDFDPVTIAKTYGQFASAISVLTETEYFQGSFEYLQAVRKNVPQPVLCKDFIVDTYQVYQARYYGADIILLILAIVDDRQWREFFELAQSLKMDVITEVSNESELERALQLQAPIVGINNRDLRDMSIDLTTTRRLRARLPDEVIVISESGFYTNSQVRIMSNCSDGFLVGSSLMAEHDLQSAVKRIIYGDNKVCGLTRNEDAVVADQAGAIYGGVIFADSSPRRILPSDVSHVFCGTKLRRVGVFQDHPNKEIIEIATNCDLNAIQLHGDENAKKIAQLRSLLDPSIEIWKAIPIDDLEQWQSVSVDRLLVDHQSGSTKGGTGKSFDWDRIPETLRGEIMIAGGIGVSNAAAAMQLGFRGVDMNSKLETAPGIKSADLINNAFSALHS